MARKQCRSPGTMSRPRRLRVGWLREGGETRARTDCRCGETVGDGVASGKVKVVGRSVGRSAAGTRYRSQSRIDGTCESCPDESVARGWRQRGPGGDGGGATRERFE